MSMKRCSYELAVPLHCAILRLFDRSIQRSKVKYINEMASKAHNGITSKALIKCILTQDLFIMRISSSVFWLIFENSKWNIGCHTPSKVTGYGPDEL